MVEKLKSKVSGLEASSFGVVDAPAPNPVGDTGLLLNGDDALGDKPYVVGTPSPARSIAA